MNNNLITNLMHIIGYMSFGGAAVCLVIAGITALRLRQIRRALKVGLGVEAGERYIEQWGNLPKQMLLPVSLGVIIGVIAFIL